MEQVSGNPPEATEDLRLRGPRRDVFVYTAIFVTALLVISMIAILCYSWVDNAEPTMIVLRGDATTDGIVVHIESPSLRFPHQFTLSSANENYTKIYLKPGRYQIFAGDKPDVKKRWLTISEEPIQIDVAALIREDHLSKK